MWLIRSYRQTGTAEFFVPCCPHPTFDTVGADEDIRALTHGPTEMERMRKSSSMDAMRPVKMNSRSSGLICFSL